MRVAVLDTSRIVNGVGRWGKAMVGLACGVASVLLVGAASAQADDLSPGDAVEVREGDVWSPAEFVRQEGRRLQIRYDDGTEEWITADRLRGAGGVDDEAGGPPIEKPRRFRTGQDVEFKNRNRWVAAEIKRASPPLYLVATKEGLGSREFHWQWVDAPRLRSPGEDHDGPDVFSQFDHGVHNDSIKDSLRKAKAAYAEHELKQSQTARDETGKRDPFAPPPFAYPVIEPDRQDMRQVAVTPGGWDRVVVDPADEPAGRDFKLKLRSGHNAFFEKPVTLSVAGGFGLVVIEDSPPGQGKRVYAEKIDLTAGRSRAAVEFEAASRPVAISPDGQTVAGVANGFHPGSRHRLDVWDWSGREPKHVVSFEPFAAGQTVWADIEDAVFADADTLVVRSRGGAVSAWDAATGQGLWEATGLSRGPSAWALSPGGEVVAVAAADHVVLLDSRTGAARASLPGAGFALSSLSFSRDGRTLVAQGRERLKGWDMQALESWPSIALRPGGGGGLLALDGGLALVGGWVFDLATGRPVWEIAVDRSAGGVGLMQAGRWVVVGKDPSQRRDAGPGFVLQAWSLPSSAGGDLARAHREATAATGSAGLLVPGDRVTLDLAQLDADGPQRQAIRETLAAQLQARGVEIAEGQAVRLVGVTTTESEQRVYESAGGAPWNREQTEVTVDTKTTRLAIEADGKPAWAWVTTTSPSNFVRIEEGQTVQQAVDASAGGDASGFLTRLQLPDVIPDPRQGPLGTTTLTPRNPGR